MNSDKNSLSPPWWRKWPIETQRLTQIDAGSSPDCCASQRCVLMLGILTILISVNRTAHCATPTLGLPNLEVTDKSNDEAAALGRQLFFDATLSRDGSISCATCHQPKHGFSDSRPVAQGIDKRLGTRNTPTLLNEMFNVAQFWDGRSESLEQQALDPLMNPREHGLTDEKDLIERIRSNRDYVRQFRAVFGVEDGEIKAVQVARALTSFEPTLIAGGSPVDRDVFHHESGALSLAAIRGLNLFKDGARCATATPLTRRARCSQIMTMACIRSHPDASRCRPHCALHARRQCIDPS